MYADMIGFCHSFKDYDGNPTNVAIQMDVDEFFNRLLDQIEERLKPTLYKDLIKKQFESKFIT